MNINIFISIFIINSLFLGCSIPSGSNEVVDTVSKEDILMKECFVNHPKEQIEMEFYEETLALVRQELEAQWQRNIPEDLVLIGGLDMFGLARFCSLPQSGLFEGEYVDPRFWIKGTFAYKHPNMEPMPEDIMNGYYMSSYAHQGLTLYSRPNHKKWIYLVPVDITSLPLP